LQTYKHLIRASATLGRIRCFCPNVSFATDKKNLTAAHRRSLLNRRFGDSITAKPIQPIQINFAIKNLPPGFDYWP